MLPRVLVEGRDTRGDKTLGEGDLRLGVSAGEMPVQFCPWWVGGAVRHCSKGMPWAVGRKDIKAETSYKVIASGAISPLLAGTHDKFPDLSFLVCT